MQANESHLCVDVTFPDDCVWKIINPIEPSNLKFFSRVVGMSEYYSMSIEFGFPKLVGHS